MLGDVTIRSRTIQIENPSSRSCFHDSPAYPGAKGRANGVNGEYYRDIIPPLSERNKIGNDNINNHVQASCCKDTFSRDDLANTDAGLGALTAYPLYCASSNQHGTAVSTVADTAAKHEKGNN
jgi:hypothetical protein